MCCFSAKSHLFLLRFGGLSNQATVNDFQTSADALLDISKIGKPLEYILQSKRNQYTVLIDLKNPAAELIPHDINDPISLQFPAIVSVTESHRAAGSLTREKINIS